MRALAKQALSDPLTIALQTHRLASELDFELPLDPSHRQARLRGCKSAVVRGVIGNSFWGHSMRAKQIANARWKKVKHVE